ncbi:MAG: flagellar assembly protein FliW [bacterium]|nr:flagellar assembly protein FliW [bacterium]
MQILTKQFGPITFEEDAVLHFPDGLFGFEHLRRFLVIDQDEVEPLRWLQPIDDPAFAFPIIEPFLVWPDYRIKLMPADREAMALGKVDPIVFALVTVPEDPLKMTANLIGPLVIHPDRRFGMQVVLHDSGYTTRQRLIPDPAAESRDAAIV